MGYNLLRARPVERVAPGMTYQDAALQLVTVLRNHAVLDAAGSEEERAGHNQLVWRTVAKAAQHQEFEIFRRVSGIEAAQPPAFSHDELDVVAAAVYRHWVQAHGEEIPNALQLMELYPQRSQPDAAAPPGYENPPRSPDRLAGHTGSITLAEPLPEYAVSQ